ncbi:MAG: hypothetical protein AAB463_01795 [Patescibacteria group bacterium]
MAFSSLEEDIVRTVAYGQSVGFPLTSIGIAERIQHAQPIGEVVVTLERLVGAGVLVSWSGRYGIGDRAKASIDEYEARAALTRVRWLRALRRVRVLAWVPWVRAVWVSGSLAYDASDADGDTDVVCLIAPGHLFSARLCALALSSLFGIRRAAHEVRAPEKLCMNHWIADNGQQLVHRSIYTAWVYAHMIPVLGDPAARQWMGRQQWMKEYLSYCAEASVQRTITTRALNTYWNALWEFLLTLLEPFAKRVQVERIRRGIATVGQGRIQANDRVLEFHPRSQEPAVLATYQALCASVGVGVSAPDSGLGVGVSDVLDIHSRLA